MFNAIASMVWALVKLVKTALFVMLCLYIAAVIGYILLCYLIFSNSN